MSIYWRCREKNEALVMGGGSARRRRATYFEAKTDERHRPSSTPNLQHLETTRLILGDAGLPKGPNVTDCDSGDLPQTSRFAA